MMKNVSEKNIARAIHSIEWAVIDFSTTADSYYYHEALNKLYTLQMLDLINSTDFDLLLNCIMEIDDYHANMIRSSWTA